MVKQCPLIVTADTTKITQESAAAGHHFWKGNLLTKEIDCIDLKKQKGRCYKKPDFTAGSISQKHTSDTHYVSFGFFSFPH